MDGITQGAAPPCSACPGLCAFALSGRFADNQSFIIMAKNKKVNAWQIIVAVFQALAALFGSLKKSHDSAHEESENNVQNPSADE